MDVRSSPDNSVRARGASISFRAAEVIREAILSGKLQPGDPLPESDLTEDLGVSQTSVREALFNLEREGLVVRVPNRGSSVLKLSEQELNERVAVYALLESAAAVEAAGRMSQAELKQIEDCALAGDCNPQPDSPRSFREADLEFHRLVWRCSGNAVLYTALDSLASPMFALATLPCESHDKQAGFGHQTIVEALRSADKHQIAQAVSEHMQRRFLRTQTFSPSLLRLMLE
jgi:DNA-binding GntR family transcriptional regulator